jgi:hypothetical protein
MPVTMTTVERWFGGNYGQLTRQQAEIAAEMAEELRTDYLARDWWVAMAEALDYLGWEA